MLVTATTVSASAPLPDNLRLYHENYAQVSPHLEGIIFNARFLDIPTYEGSGQMVHPHVVFSREQFLGYHYIMAMTPYPFSNNAFENPSILGSQDGVIWDVPEGVINPVMGIPPDVAVGGHFSDPFVLRNGDNLELWFRHTLGRSPDGQPIRRNSHNRIYRSISTDLANWGEVETIFCCPDNANHFMSVVVMHNDAQYRVWYTNFDSVLFYVESYDLENWSERRRVNANLGGLGVWHHDIVFTGKRYEALFTASNWGNHPTFRLFYANSHDGFNFGTGREIRIDRISPELESMTVHKCTFVKIDGVYQMYIAAFTRNNVWRLFYFEIAVENLYRLFDKADWMHHIDPHLSANGGNIVGDYFK